MRLHRVALFCLLLSIGTAAAEEEPSPPARPRTPEQAADAVLEAHGREDQRALAALAGNDQPDPWLVADELCARSAHDAAAAFARATSGKAVEKLPAYVASQREAEPDASARAALVDTMKAAAARDWPRLVELAVASGPLRTVVGIRLACARGEGLFRTRRAAEAGTVLLRAAEAAEGLGWLARSSRTYHQAGSCAHQVADLRAAASAWSAQLRIQRSLGDAAGLAGTLNRLGLVSLLSGEPERAIEHLDESLQVARGLGLARAEAKTRNTLGGVHEHLGRYAEALAHFRKALAIFQELGDRAASAKALGNMGNLERLVGKHEDARAHMEQALAIEREIDDQPGVAATLNNLGILHATTGRPEEALQAYRASLAIKRKLDNPADVARTLDNLATLQDDLGNYERALELLGEAEAIQRRLDEKLGLGRTLHARGRVAYSLGEYAAALRHYDDALVLLRSHGSPTDVAALLHDLGNVHLGLRDHEEALRRYEASLEIERRLGRDVETAHTLTNIGNVHEDAGNHTEALERLREALAIHRRLGRTKELAATLNTIGNVHRRLGSAAEALRAYGESFEIEEGLANAVGMAATLVNIGNVHKSAGDLDRAMATLARARTLLGDAPHADYQAHVAWALADLHLRRGDAAEALAWSRRGVVWVTGLAGRLAEEQGAGAREAFVGLFDAGYRAAARTGKAEDLLWFLEMGRAGSLREALGSRAALEAATIPAPLLADLNMARAHERRALGAYREARSEGRRKAVRSARARWEEAQAEVGRIASRIEREAKASAGVTLAAPDTLETVQGRLAPAEALVLYATTSEETVALVVRREEARAIRLPPSSQVGAAVGELLDGERHVDPTRVEALHALLIKPLDLGGDVRRVLVSPTGRLGYVPFSLLLPAHEVACVPSASTYGLLLTDRGKRGARVLAVGDPDYRARPDGLPPLPATRAEVEAIGTVKLLGSAATETGLRSKLKDGSRWRAVHFACHGLIDAERPLRSALALTSSKSEDGYLRALEIFRLRIPADLVVMSACETARGRIYETEGIVGLTRAFMFAAAPRVLCSLWKVDDAATQALMLEFYRLWHPKDGSHGLHAAEALKQAQAHVRSHDKWKHPYYWAAWQLWGLPE